MKGIVWTGVAAAMWLTLACPAHTEGLAFKAAPAEVTGLRKIMETWKAEELARVGGKAEALGWWPWGLTTFDYDRDGDIDLLATQHSGRHGILIKGLFKETGKLAFVEATKEVGLERADLPCAIGRRSWAWDFDGDGWLDLIGIRSENLLNKGGKRFEKIGKSPFDNFHPKEIIDLNGDGYPDILTTDGAMFVYVPESKTFKQLKADASAIPSLIPAELKKTLDEMKQKKNNRFFSLRYHTEYDLNGDGIKDVVIGGEGAYGADVIGRYLLADKDGKLSDRTAELGLPTDGAPILIHDLTGDGYLDILVATGPRAGLYLNDGKGHFAVKDGALKKFLEQGGPYLHRAWLADFDNDGDPDLVVSNPRLGAEQVYENEGGGNFRKVLDAGGWDSDPVCIADMNDDGLPDLAIGGPGHQASTDITIYLNETPHPGNFCNLYPVSAAPNPYAVGALVEVHAAGAMGKQGVIPLLVEKAHPDATPVHVGLGAATTFDLRVTFPGKEPKVVELKAVEAKKKLRITPNGNAEEIK